MKKVLIRAALLVLVVGGGIFAYGYFVVHRHKGPVKPSLQQLKSWQFPLPQITGNTADGDMAQLTVVFQAGNQQTFQQLKLAETQLSSLVVATLLTVPGHTLKTPQGERTLESDLLKRADTLIPHASLLAVDIPQMVVQ